MAEKEEPKKPDVESEEARQKELKALKEKVRLSKEALEAAKTELGIQQKLNDGAEKNTDLLEAESDFRKANITFRKEEILLKLKSGEIDKKAAELLTQDVKKDEDKYKRLQSTHEWRKKQNELLEKEAATNTLIVLSSIGIEESAMRIYDNIKKSKEAGDKTSALFFVWQSVMMDAANFAAKMFITIADGNAEFAAQTGHVADRFATFGMGMSRFGIGFEKMNKAAGELYTTMSSFSTLNNYVQQDLAESAAKLANLGVSVGVSAKNYDVLNKSLRMTAQQAKATNEDIAKAAIGAGIAPSKMVGEFAQNMGRLSAYGKQGIDVFIGLEKQAKSLGMEVSTLTGIVGDQFDTFEGSARAAGKLNAVLGGNFLNSVDMLNASEEERVMLLKQSFDASGKSWDALSKYEKKAVAATLGISDLNEASKLLGNSTTDLAVDMEAQAAKQEQLEKVQAEAAKVSDKLKEAMNGLMIAVKPLVEIVSFFANVIARMNDFLGGFGGLIWMTAGAVTYMASSSTFLSSKLKLVGLDLTGIGTKFKTMGLDAKTGAFSLKAFATSAMSSLNPVKLLKGALSSPMSAFGLLTTIMTVVSVLQQLHETLLVPHSPILLGVLIMLPFIIMAIGRAADASSTGLLNLGGAVLMVGAGVGLAAFGLSQLVEAFKGLTGPQIMGALGAIALLIGGFIIAIYLLASASVATTVPLLLLGAAFLMLGAGIALAGLGIKMVVDSFGKVASPDFAKNISAFGSALLDLVLPMGLLALVAPGVLIVSAALLILSIAAVIAGVGISLIAEGFSKLTNPQLPEQMAIFAEAVGNIALPLLFLSLLSPLLIVLGVSFLAFGLAITLASFGLKTLAEGMSKLTDPNLPKGMASFAEAVLMISPALAILALMGPGLLFVGAAFLLLGAGVTLAAVGIRMVAEGFAKLADPNLPAAMDAFAESVIKMTPAFIILSLFSPGLLVAGLGFFLLGAGAMMAGKGLQMITESLAKLTDPSLPKLLFAFADAIITLSPALIILSFLGPGLILTAIAFTIFGAAINLIGTGLETLIKSFKELSNADIADAMFKLVDALAIATPALIGLSLISPLLLVAGVAFMLLAVALQLIGPGLIQAADGFMALSNPAVIEGMFGLVGALYALFWPLIALTLTIPTLMALGFAFLAIGIGSMMFATSLNIITESLTKLTEIIEPAFNAMLKLSEGLLILSVGMLGIMALGAVGASGFGLIAFTLGLVMMTGAIVALGAAMEEIPENKTVALKSLNETLVNARLVTDDNIKPAKEFISAAKEFYKAQADSKEADKDVLVQALKEVFSSQNKSQESQKDITLVIKGDDWVKAIKSGDMRIAGKLNMGV